MLLNTFVKRLGVRNVSSSVRALEVKIPMPFGHISGKWWGPTNQRPVVCIHGWQDNCASFDPLIPLLPSNISYLAIDKPGHGLSSHLAPGVFYHGVNSVFTLKSIKNFFGWQKISLMGHSLGAMFAYNYGFINPQEVDFMICLDGLYPVVPNDPIKRAARSVEEFATYRKQAEDKNEPPSFTMDELCEKLYRTSMKSIDLQNCALMLQRNVTQSKLHPGKYFMHRDPRVKTGLLLTWSMQNLLDAAKGVTFPIFISRSTGCPLHRNQEVFKQHLEILQRNSADFEFHKVKGTHHVHFNQPEVFQGILPAFITKHSKDTERNIGEFNRDIVVN